MRQKEPSQLDRMLQIAAGATLSLSQHNQPHALLPTGNSVPLASEPFYSWLSQALSEKGFNPSASQLGHLTRQLDAQAHNHPRYEQIHFRAVKTAPKSYKFDLNNSGCQVIELTPSGWKVDIDFETRIFRPDASLPYLYPERVKPKFHQCLEKLFHLKTETAKHLTAWIIQALLPGETPAALVITGKARHQAAEKIRTMIDPNVCPIQAMPGTIRQLGRLAISNSIMAFSIGHQLTPNRLAALNELRTGLMVELRQVSKHRDPISAFVQRPVILSTEKVQKIHEGQLEIEINDAEAMDRAHLLASLFNAAVVALEDLEERPVIVVELELEAPEIPPPLDPQPHSPDP